VLLRAAFDAAVAEADPLRCVLRCCRFHRRAHDRGRRRQGRGCDGPRRGSRLGRGSFGHGRDGRGLCRRLPAHRSDGGDPPLPAEAGQQAAERLLRLVSGLGRTTFVICLISGGGSALLPLPADGLGLEGKQAITRALLRSGATNRRKSTGACAGTSRASRGKAGCCVPSRAPRDARHLGRAGRPSARHRVGPDGGGSDDLPGCARGARAPSHGGCRNACGRRFVRVAGNP